LQKRWKLRAEQSVRLASCTTTKQQQNESFTAICNSEPQMGLNCVASASQERVDLMGS
jgi:hypothetical protein